MLVFKNFDEMISKLDDRDTTIKVIDDISDIYFDNYDLYMKLSLKDENSIVPSTEEYYIPKYVFSHLAQFLDIPTNTYEYIFTLSQLPKSKKEIALKNEAQHLHSLFRKRSDKKRVLPLKLHIVNDVFGTFPRCISTKTYQILPDSEFANIINNLVISYNKDNDMNFTFSMGKMTPSDTMIAFISESKEDFKLFNEEVGLGITAFNSEFKSNAVRLLNAITRLQCENGLYSMMVRDMDIRIKHVVANIEDKIKNAFYRVILKLDRFYEYLKRIESYDRVISDNWDDLLKIPSQYLPLRPKERRKLIEIAKKEGYPFNIWGIINTLTYYTSHKTEYVDDIERYNKKAFNVINYAHNLNNDIETIINELNPINAML